LQFLNGWKIFSEIDLVMLSLNQETRQYFNQFEMLTLEPLRIF
jgi:hypothetical protein